MKVTLLGHATLLVETAAGNVLTDPVFDDPFEEGAVASCPKREIDASKLPKLDVVFISHSHLDHFDVPTLARLPRDVTVICPEDERITYALSKLGYRDVRPTEPSSTITFGALELLTTHSNTKEVVELGVVFKDPSGTFWNPVDTVITPGTIEWVKLQVGSIDLLFAVHASQNFGFFGSMRSGYPLDIPRRNLENVKRVAPKLVVPGSAGFRFDGPFEWTNAFLFPISRDRFLDDLKRVAPELPQTIANPGDVFEIDRGMVTRHAAASPIARMVEDDLHRIEFDATAPVPPLTDPNVLDYPDELLEKHANETFDALEALVTSGYSKRDPIVVGYRDQGLSYATSVVFPDGRERTLRVDFLPDAPKVTRAEGRPLGAMYFHRIAASALASWVRCDRSYYWYRGFSRRSQVIPATMVNGNVSIPAHEWPDLLAYYVDRSAPGAKDAWRRRLDARLAPFVK